MICCGHACQHASPLPRRGGIGTSAYRERALADGNQGRVDDGDGLGRGLQGLRLLCDYSEVVYDLGGRRLAQHGVAADGQGRDGELEHGELHLEMARRGWERLGDEMGR